MSGPARFLRDNWLWIALLLAAAGVYAWTRRADACGGAVAALYANAAPGGAVARPRKPALSNVPDGTPFGLADAMRLSVDDVFPRIGDAVVETVHDDAEGRLLIGMIVDRLNSHGASVTPIALQVAQFSKGVDANKVARYDLEFLVHDNQLTSPGYPANQIVKLKATMLRAPRQPFRIFALGFATPRDAAGGPQGYDPRDADHRLARWDSPLEILKQMHLGPGAQVQT